jgi:hypothetical protein
MRMPLGDNSHQAFGQMVLVRNIGALQPLPLHDRDPRLGGCLFPAVPPGGLANAGWASDPTAFRIEEGLLRSQPHIL